MSEENSRDMRDETRRLVKERLWALEEAMKRRADIVEKAAKVAKGLSDQQREDILESGERFFWSADGRTTRGLERKGLIAPDGLKWRWLPLGLAVRDYLEANCG